LSEAAPRFAEELARIVLSDEDPTIHDLSAQIAELKIAARCGCGDSFCATFYAVTDPPRPHPPGSDTLALDADRGIVNIDIAPDGRIIEVEVLDRPDLKSILDQILPVAS
jgi:hypothetical protein